MSDFQNRGFTLIELLIALALGLFLSASMIQLLLQSQRTYAANEMRINLAENARFAVAFITRDIRRAGFLGIHYRAAEPGVALLIDGSLGSLSDDGSCVSGEHTWPRMLNRGLYGLNDSVESYDCLPARDHLRGDVFISRFAEEIQSGSIQKDDLYFRSDGLRGKVFLGEDAGHSDNLLSDQPQQEYRLRGHIDYLRNTPRRCQGVPIPALYRKTLTRNGRLRSEEVVAGIEQLQFQFRVGGHYLNANAVGDWSQVESVKMWVLVRAECPEFGYEDTQSYRMGDITYQPSTANRGREFRRQLHTSLVAIRREL